MNASFRSRLRSDAWFIGAGLVLSLVSMLFNILFYLDVGFSESAGMRGVGVVAMVAMETAKLGMIVFVLPTTTKVFPRVAAGLLLVVSGLAAFGTTYAAMMPDVAAMQRLELDRLAPLHAEAVRTLDAEFAAPMAEAQAGMEREMRSMPGPRYRAYAAQLAALRADWQGRRAALLAAHDAERTRIARAETFEDDIRARVRKVEGLTRAVNVLLSPVGASVSYAWMSVALGLLLGAGIEAMVYLTMGHVGERLAPEIATRRAAEQVARETQRQMADEQAQHRATARRVRDQVAAMHEGMEEAMRRADTWRGTPGTSTPGGDGAP